MLMYRAERYKSLVEKKVVAQQQYEQFSTNAEALDATLLADKAAIDNAIAAARASQEAVENAKAAVQADRASPGKCKNPARILLHLFARLMVGPVISSVHRGNIVKPDDTSLSGCHQPDQSHLCDLFSS